MYRDGRLIRHFTRRLKPDVDQDILSGMLTAVQEFVKDTFRGEEGELDQMKFGRFQVLIGRGRFINIAAVVIGEEIEPFRPQIAKTVDDIEADYEVLLRDWDGDVGELKVLGRYVNDLIDGRYSYGRV
jgi:OOP family OmpA-OmpF porin